MIKAYFISDLHIGASEDEEEYTKQQHVLRFLEEIAADATHLYIVGDLFDFWFEYKHVIPKKIFQFLYELNNMTRRGVEIHYLAGNHDFALDGFFPEFMKIKVWLNEYTFTLGGKQFYLFHGDGIAKKDVGYRFLKRILRNRLNQRLFRLLHPDWGIPLARLVSGSSRKYTNQMNHLRDESDYINFAEERFSEGYDYVLMGHRHNPLVHKKGKNIYINLGDWITRFSYACFDGQNMELRFYPMEGARMVETPAGRAFTDRK